MAQEDRQPEGDPRQARDADWQDTLLREWRYCLDDVVAARLWVGVSELPPSVTAVEAIAQRAWLACALIAFVALWPAAFLVPLPVSRAIPIAAAVVGTLAIATTAALRAAKRVRRARTWKEFLPLAERWLRAIASKPPWTGRRFWGRDLPPELRYRHRYFWWDGRPTAEELWRAMEHPDAPKVVRELADAVRASEGLGTDILIGHLSSRRLAERAGAFYALGLREAEVIPALLAAPPDAGAMRHERAVWTAAYAAESASRRWKEAQGGLLCCECWVPLRLKQVAFPRDEIQRTGTPTVNVPACPACGRSRGAYEHHGPVVLAVDAAGSREPVRVGSELWVNWLALAREEHFEGQRLFDCIRVEIVNASDQEVEHLLVDVTSDTNAERKAGWSKMTCRVRAGAGLSENTLNALRGVFGSIEITGRA